MSDVSIEDIYLRLKTIKSTVDKKKDESFENKKAFKYLYNSILDILDSLVYLEESDDLLDDDWMDKKDIEIEEENYEASNPDKEEPEYFKPKIDIDDLI
jgi:hypothetical protein